MNFNDKSINEIKKLFSSVSNGTNFFGEFTLNDVDTCKKRLYQKYILEYPYEHDKIVNYLDNIGTILYKSTYMTKQNNINTNTHRDIDIKYINRITEIDSQYRNDLLQQTGNESNFSCQLTDTLTNVTSIKLDNISIPYTFYNIETSQGNNIFKVDDDYITITGGNYDMSTLVSTVNGLLTDVSFSYDTITGKTTLNNDLSKNILFYSDIDINFKLTKINNSFGWILGFRDVVTTSSSVTSLYNSSSTSSFMSYIPQPKYFIILIDDHNSNQSNKSLVQMTQGSEVIKNTSYYKNINEQKNNYFRKYGTPDLTLTGGDICLDNITTNNLQVDDNRNITKKQLYSQAAINETNNIKNLKIKQENMPNILAIVPFETKSLIWGKSIFFSDKNNYVREYHGPVDIEKISIKIMDDKGVILNLNGNEWSATVLTKHLYKC